ncbi:Uncharacterised protein [uncultured archaeon]|nr:Uncharacterised protein [uncultured archaeon]
MPQPLSSRVPGWLLREHYKNVMRRKANRFAINSDTKGARKTNSYRFAQSLYRSYQIPNLAKLLESYIESGQITKGFADHILSTQLKAFTELHEKIKEQEKEIVKKPRQSIEKTMGRFGGFKNVFVDKQNNVEAIMTANGKGVTLLIKAHKP